MNTYGPDLGDYPYASAEELEAIAKAERLLDDKRNGIETEKFEDFVMSHAEKLRKDAMDKVYITNEGKD